MLKSMNHKIIIPKTTTHKTKKKHNRATKQHRAIAHMMVSSWPHLLWDGLCSFY